VKCVELPQTDARLCPASVATHAAILEGRITFPPDPDLARHAASAVVQHSRRGWRISSPARGVQVDSMIALAALVVRVQEKPPPAKLLGWR
jgi:hypothetical protein